MVSRDSNRRYPYVAEESRGIYTLLFVGFLYALFTYCAHSLTRHEPRHPMGLSCRPYDSWALYGLYYRIHRRDGLWVYAFVFVFLNAFVFSWQIYQAILNSTDTSWGTRQVRQVKAGSRFQSDGVGPIEGRWFHVW